MFGVVKGTVIVSLGSTAGATAAFLVGRTIARDWVARRLAGRPKMAAIARAVETEGFKIVLLTRLSPVLPFNLLNYAFGLTAVPLRKYILASWIGMLPGTIMYVYLGSAANSLAALLSGDQPRSTGQQVLFVLAARGESLAAFDGRCIPDGGVAPRSNTPGMLGRRALPAGRLARLGATPDFHHGLLGLAATVAATIIVTRTARRVLNEIVPPY